MNSYEDKVTDKAREYYVVAAQMEELQRTKEELKQAKDEAMESWLDSRPLIDELERLKEQLAIAKNQSEDPLVSTLESELMAINTTIRAKKEEELRIRREINEMTRVSESTREEMEKVKLETSEGRGERSKLKEVIKIRRQSLRALKLTLRAIRLESEAYSSSAAAALHQINRARTDNGMTVELSQEDYFVLVRRAKEETSLADWRVNMASEQRIVAEESQDLALQRLEKIKTGEICHSDKTFEDDVPGVRLRVQTPFPKAREGGRKGNKKKRSIFSGIKSFLAKKIRFLFG